MGLKRQSVQRLVDILSAERIFEFFTKPQSQRAELVSLTPKGVDLLAKMTRIQMKWVNQLAETLEQVTLEGATATLGALEVGLRAQPKKARPRRQNLS